MKYTDPDGEQSIEFNFWGFLKNMTSGTDRLFFFIMQYFSADRPSNKVNPDYLISKLSETNYKLPNNDLPVLKNSNSRNIEKSFLLADNFVKNLATALPAQSDATLEDTVDIKGGFSAAVLGLSVAGKMTRGIGNISFNYTLSNEKVSDWSLTEKTSDGKNILYRTYTKIEALDFLNKNKDKICEKSNEFKKIIDKLD